MITILTVGKCKYKEFEIYLSRCKDTHHVFVKEVKDDNKELIKRKEGDAALNKVHGDLYVLSEEGEQMGSVKFSKLLDCKATFLIGGAYGVSQEVKDRAKKIISISKMTMPHEMVHLILAEQIYRGQKILEGHPYHKV